MGARILWAGLLLLGALSCSGEAPSIQSPPIGGHKPRGNPRRSELLVAFIGEQRRWGTTWRSQQVFLQQELGPFDGANASLAWSSMACLSTNDHGLELDGLRGLRIGRVVRTMTSAWWGTGDDPEAAFFCEQGNTRRGGASKNSWVTKQTADGKTYYVNRRTGKSSWNKPVQLHASFQASMLELVRREMEELIGNASLGGASLARPQAARTVMNDAKTTATTTTTTISKTNSTKTNSTKTKKKKMDAVGAGCFLRRLTACREQVLAQCRRVGCRALLVLRPDLELIPRRPDGGAGPFGSLVRAVVAASEPLAPASEASGKTAQIGGLGPWAAVFSRLRCVGAGEEPRTAAWPAQLCNGRPALAAGARDDGSSGNGSGDGGSGAGSGGSLWCPSGRFTLDDQLALAPATLAPSLLRDRFEPPVGPQSTRACPATWDWPEGVLTTTLLNSGVAVRELPGVTTRQRDHRNGTVGAAVDF